MQIAIVLLALPAHSQDNFAFNLALKIPSVSVKSFPVLQLEPNYKKLEVFAYDFNKFDWLVLSSSYGAQVFFEHLQNKNLSLPKNLKIAVVGPSVAKVADEAGYKISLQPKQYNLINLTKALQEQAQITDKKFLLIVGSKSSSEILEEALTANNRLFTKLEIYQSKLVQSPNWMAFNEFTQAIENKKIVCLSSPECAKAFYKLLQDKNFSLPTNCQMVCLGPATLANTKELFPNYLVHSSPEYSYNGMIQKIAQLTQD
jgi:uroporphyrinogen-III synthase